MRIIKKRVYVLDDGRKTTIRAEYIRQEFKKGKSRSQIRKELGISYDAVYQATAGMDNGTVQNRRPVVLKFSDGSKMLRADYIREQVVKYRRTVSEVARELGIDYISAYAPVRGMDIPKMHQGKPVMIKHPETGEKVRRIDYIREQYRKGKSCREIANAINCDYRDVYNVIYRIK